MQWRVATKSYGPVVLVLVVLVGFGLGGLWGKMSEYVADYGVGMPCSVWSIDSKRVDGWYLRLPARAEQRAASW